MEFGLPLPIAHAKHQDQDHTRRSHTWRSMTQPVIMQHSRAGDFVRTFDRLCCRADRPPKTHGSGMASERRSFVNPDKMLGVCCVRKREHLR